MTQQNKHGLPTRKSDEARTGKRGSVMNKFLAAIAVAAAAFIGFATPTQAGLFSAFQPKPKIVATVSLSDQKMYVAVTDNRGQTKNYAWDVSTGANGFETPTGKFTPTWLSKDHKSKQYDDAPMPFAVFFNEGIAVHGTQAISQLGKRAPRMAASGSPRRTPPSSSTWCRPTASSAPRSWSRVKGLKLRTERDPPRETPISRHPLAGVSVRTAAAGTPTGRRQPVGPIR